MSNDDRLAVFIGHWMTQGKTVAGVPIVGGDVYTWGPGGCVVMHPYHGLIGDLGVGGLEVISPDPKTGQYGTHFFDGEGNVSMQTLSLRDGVWYWLGPRTRCKGVFSEGGRKLTAHHERSDDGEQWAPSMTVTLRKI